MPLTKEQIDTAMGACLDLQKTATTLHDKRPFAALLLGPDNSTILLTHYSISHVQHAETELARLASIHFSQKYLASCTLVSTWEPCAMCTGTLYWSNIGRLVYAASEEKLNDLTGGHNEENMTMSLPCREVLKHGQKDVEVIGPVSGWEENVIEESGKWWKDHQARENAGKLREGSVNGIEKPGSLSSMRHGTPTTWTGEEAVLSSIDDEGEYKAELDIDWMR
jgi:tRNA(Arg) A34 adenosine deaminase TadA